MGALLTSSWLALGLVACGAPAPDAAGEGLGGLGPEDLSVASEGKRDAADGSGFASDGQHGDGRSGTDAASGPCPADMVLVQSVCLDRYEAPNVPGAQPLVMYTFLEAEAWCQARKKRLCYDDDWTLACATAAGLKYPYGNTHLPGTCTDNKVWKPYDQSKLNGWPASVSSPTVASLADLFAAARAKGGAAAVAADHVEWLYQATPSGAAKGCTNSFGTFDTQGNAEEWTRRRDGGTPSFHGNLKGRYWAEARTCQSGVTTHGDGFRFYEIGFRCCRDPAP